MTAEDGAKAGARLREMMDANRADRERRQGECGFTACVDRHQAQVGTRVDGSGRARSRDAIETAEKVAPHSFMKP